MELKEIAKIYTDFPEKFGIPRQSGLIEGLTGKIIFSPEYQNPDIIRGMEQYSYLWLIWGFSESKRKHPAVTVRPPRLGGKIRMGVFATRSPFRPNALGLSSVKLESIRIDPKLGPVITVSGIDMLNETPVYDIKPYLAHVDSHPDAEGGFAAAVKNDGLTVNIAPELCARIAPSERKTVLSLLAHDPRDRFIHDENRIWGFTYRNYNIRFQVKEQMLTVLEIQFL